MQVCCFAIINLKFVLAMARKILGDDVTHLCDLSKLLM